MWHVICKVASLVLIYVWRWRFNLIVAMIIISSLRQSSLTCKHGKIFLFSSHKNEIDVLLLLHLISDRNLHIFNCRKICRGGKNLASSYPGVAFLPPYATPWLRACLRGLLIIQDCVSHRYAMSTSKGILCIMWNSLVYAIRHICKSYQHIKEFLKCSLLHTRNKFAKH